MALDITTIAATDKISDSRAVINTNFDNIATDLDALSDNLENLTDVEITQLEAIGATTISATQWGYLGALDQSLTKASSPTFAGTLGCGAITLGANTIGRDADNLIDFSTDNEINIGTNLLLDKLNLIKIDENQNIIFGRTSATGAADGTVANHLQDDTSSHFIAAMVGGIVYNITDETSATITGFNDIGDLTLSDDIFEGGETYKIMFFNIRDYGTADFSLTNDADYYVFQFGSLGQFITNSKFTAGSELIINNNVWKIILTY